MSNVVRRSTQYTVAAIVNLVFSLAGIVFALPVLFQGSQTAADSGDQPPFGVIVLAFALGIIGVVASYGVWKMQRWGVVLCIVVNALNFLSGLPGVFFGPTLFLKVGSIVACVANLVIIYLLLRRRTAPATLAASA